MGCALTSLKPRAKIFIRSDMNRVIEGHKLASGQLLLLVQGDITQENVNAIVNAANSYLQHGGGVAGAIALSGGPQIQKESDAWVREYGPVSHSKPAYTGAGNLPCEFVFHAVGPVWGEGEEDEKLRLAVNASLQLANELKIISIALPAISTGIFGFPKVRAARVILEAIRDHLDENPFSSLAVIRIILSDQQTLNAFLKVWKELGFGQGG